MAAVLIVDDNATHCENLARLLRRHGHTVTCAPNGRDALAALVQRPDLILLDVEMPVLDGIGFLELFRSSVVGAVPPVILLSGVEDERCIERAKELGVAKVLNKGSCPPHELLDCIADTLVLQQR